MKHGSSGLHPKERARRDLFLERIAEIVGVSRTNAEELVRQRLASAVRVNRLARRPPEEILADLEVLGVELSPIPWCADAYELLSDKRAVSESDLFWQGEVYLQNASSLIPALALAPEPGDAILDVCAAPGGKAAHIAALTGNRSHLWVNDAIKPRQEKLREVLGILDVAYEELTGHPGQYIDKYVERRFDRILLDAQCSGEGMENLNDPQALRFWTPSRITKMSFLQKKMLAASWKLLEPGGTLVYSTCTYAPEENEEPVDHLLRHHPDATVEPIPLEIPAARPGLTAFQGKRYDPRVIHALRVIPDGRMEAFFVCKLRKAAEGPA